MTDFTLSSFQLGLGLGEGGGFGARRRSPPSVGGFILPFPHIKAIAVNAQFGRHSGSGLTTAQPVIYRFAFKGLIEGTTFSDRSLAHDVGTSLFALSISVNSKQPQGQGFLTDRQRLPYSFVHTDYL